MRIDMYKSRIVCWTEAKNDASVNPQCEVEIGGIDSVWHVGQALVFRAVDVFFRLYGCVRRIHIDFAFTDLIESLPSQKGGRLGWIGLDT